MIRYPSCLWPLIVCSSPHSLRHSDVNFYCHFSFNPLQLGAYYRGNEAASWAQRGGQPERGQRRWEFATLRHHEHLGRWTRCNARAITKVTIETLFYIHTLLHVYTGLSWNVGKSFSGSSVTAGFRNKSCISLIMYSSMLKSMLPAMQRHMGRS